MRVVTFASGSSGNCALLSLGGAHFLLDAGISLRRIRTALAGLGLTPDDLTAVLVTHEHADHVSGLAMLTKYHALPLYAPGACAGYLHRTLPAAEAVLHRFSPGECFTLGGVTIQSFPTAHDAPDSVGYRLEAAGERFAVCTDTGFVSPEMMAGLTGCPAVLIEANHDRDMLLAGPYPMALKRRILSDRGHLSNADCGKLACWLYETGTREFILAHLSRENNTPQAARQAVETALAQAGFARARVHVAPAAESLTVEIQEADTCWA